MIKDEAYSLIEIEIWVCELFGWDLIIDASEATQQM